MKKILLSIGVIAGAFFVSMPISAAEYEVQVGDSLWKIAKENETTVKELKELNQLSSNIIHPNQVLKLDREITYVVQKGDSLSTIAHEYGVEVANIKEWNQLETNVILIGDELLLKDVQVTNKNNKASTIETPVASEPAVQTLVKKQPKDVEKKEAKKTITVTATAYTAECDGCSGITATGVNLLDNRNMKVIAVDPRVIPLGTKVYVEGYGEAIAADTGGAIKGNIIDLHVPTKEEALNWGRRSVEVTILN